MGVAWKLRLAAGVLWLPFGLLGAIIVLTELDRVTQTHSSPVPTALNADASNLASDRAATRTEADQWASVARAASRFDEAEKTSEMSPAVAALAQALSERRFAIANARELVRDRPDEEFKGKGAFRADFERVAQAEKATRDVKRELEDWVNKPLKTPDRKEVADFLDGLETRLADYRKKNTADKQFAASQELEGRAKAIQAFGQTLQGRYARALDDLVRQPELFPAIGDDTDALLNDFREALRIAEVFERSGVLAPGAAELVKTVRGQLSGWTSRREVLAVIANYPDDPKAAEARFAEAKLVYDQIKDEKFKAAIRGWAQRYCTRFLPEKVALDPELTYDTGKLVRVQRRDVVVVYAQRGDSTNVEEIPLTDDPDDDKVNEFRFRDVAPMGYQFSTLRHVGDRDFQANELKHTDRNKAVRAYYLARRKASLWSPTLLAAMHNDVCEEFLRLEGVAKPTETAGFSEDAAYDRKRTEARAKILKVINARPVIGSARAARVWDRIAVLADAAKKSPELFEPDA